VRRIAGGDDPLEGKRRRKIEPTLVAVARDWLRLTHQSRYTPAAACSVARNDRGAGRRPWEEPGPADEYFT